MLEELREQVVFYGNEMLRQGLTLHTGGNVSARAGEYMVIKPSSVPYALIRPQDVTVMDLRGNVLEGLPPSSEWRLHAALYRAFPWIGAVVHTHSLYACMMAARGAEVPLLHQELGRYCARPVQCAPFATAGTPEVGEGAVAAMGQCNQVALLKNHGLVAMGKDLWQAMDAACAAELSCAMHSALHPGRKRSASAVKLRCRARQSNKGWRSVSAVLCRRAEQCGIRKGCYSTAVRAPQHGSAGTAPPHSMGAEALRSMKKPQKATPWSVKQSRIFGRVGAPQHGSGATPPARRNV